jgi:hypothetical protein
MSRPWSASAWPPATSPATPRSTPRCPTPSTWPAPATSTSRTAAALPAPRPGTLEAVRQHAQGTAPKRVQEKTTLELYRYHEERMRKLGMGALERFYTHFSRPVVA